MKQLKVRSIAFAVAMLAALPAAHAQATRTWVSGVGDDINPCSRTAPCKTFAGAISKTAAGGEISVLDPGSYGTLTITKSLTVDGQGMLGGVLAVGINGITVNAGATDKVVIRNISIQGAGTGLSGIRFLAGKQLHVENVTIHGFTTRGIDVSLAASANLYVRDTKITNAATGIRITTTAGLALAMLDDVHLEGNTNGLELAANGRATISNSVISGNTGTGILANASTAVVNVENCQIAFNDTAGVSAAVSGSLVRVSNNHIYNNTAGISIVAGGLVETAGNNRVEGNSSSAPPNGGSITLQ
jgi:hypothetical protein